jgi:hypothetical protein
VEATAGTKVPSREGLNILKVALQGSTFAAFSRVQGDHLEERPSKNWRNWGEAGPGEQHQDVVHFPKFKSQWPLFI